MYGKIYVNRVWIYLKIRSYNMDISIFREYDIRGIYFIILDEKGVFSIGVELGKIMWECDKSVFVGYDVRVYGRFLFEVLSVGL